ncbi:MAG TPA: DUF4340 domain-containing protein [Rudaea sp.]|jgi:hypothetical protein|nr:DUF4340 domain-containing protein [Rudaea sp.]
MKTKTLYILIGAAVIALIIAFAMNRASAPKVDVADRALPVVPGLKDHVNDITGLTFTGAGDKILVTLRREKDGWSIAEKSSYPADLTKLREFLLKLSQATVIEEKTSNPKRYAELGVDDVKDANATGVRVDIAGLAQPTKLIIGNFNGAGGGGTFVRRDGDAQSVLASGNLTVAKNVNDWEKRDLADIPSSRIQSVTLTSAEGKTWKAYKEQPGDANLKVADVPKGREVSSDYAANSVSTVLSNLRADDATTSKDAAPPDKTAKAHYVTTDGLIIDATTWQKDNKDHAQFTVSLDTAAANADIDRAQAKAKADYDATTAKKPAADAKPEVQQAEPPKPLAVSDPAKDRQQKLDALNAEVATLKKTFDGWTFTLPTYKYTDLTKSIDDVLKPLETKKPDAKTVKAPAKPASK